MALFGIVTKDKKDIWKKDYKLVYTPSLFSEEEIKAQYEAAINGDIDDQYFTGVALFTGIGLQNDYEYAVIFFNEVAKSNQFVGAKAKTMLGRCYQDGLGVSKDYNKMLKYYNEARTAGDPDANFYLGCCYDTGIGVIQNKKKAVELWEETISYQYAFDTRQSVNYLLGFYYYNGIGVNKNYSKAYSFFKKAAESGHENAYLYLGIMFASGQGVLQDYTKARQYWEQAAMMGVVAAKNNLTRLSAMGY